MLKTVDPFAPGSWKFCTVFLNKLKSSTFSAPGAPLIPYKLKKNLFSIFWHLSIFRFYDQRTNRENSNLVFRTKTKVRGPRPGFRIFW